MLPDGRSGRAAHNGQVRCISFIHARQPRCAPATPQVAPGLPCLIAARFVRRFAHREPHGAGRRSLAHHGHAQGRWRAGLALLLVSLLSACGDATSGRFGQRVLRGTTFVMIGSRGHAQISKAVLEEQERLLQLLDDDFRTLHPETRLQLDLFQETVLPSVVASRSRDGLGPDLMLVSSGTARSLMDAGLSRPVPLSAELRRVIPATLLSQVAEGPDQLVGVPVLLEPQLACFNRARLPQGPTSLAHLEALSEQGIEVGLPIDAFDLYWTVGALGANGAMARLSRGQPLDAADQQIGRAHV